jgi:hypothetical protein
MMLIYDGQDGMECNVMISARKRSANNQKRRIRNTDWYNNIKKTLLRPTLYPFEPKPGPT